MVGRLWVVVAATLAVASACGGGGGSGTPAVTPAPSSTGASTSTTAPAATDAEDIERRLVEEQRSRSEGLAVGGASCPNGAPEGDIGATVECTVQVEGVDIPYSVILVGAAPAIEGGAPRYEVKPAKPVVNVVSLVSTIRTEAAGQLKVAPERLKVDCGPAKVQVLDVGGTIRCTVVNGRETRRLVATVTDDSGTTSIKEV